MPWFRLDDSFHSHPKVIAAGNEAIGLYVRCGAYAAQHLTDGFIPEHVALLYGSATLADTLVQTKLWRRARGGWRMPDYLDFNPSREQVVDKRKVRAEAGRKGGVASGKSRSKHEANGSGLLEPPSRPVPSIADVVNRPNRSSDTGDLDEVIMTEIRTVTGRHVTAEWAAKIGGHILSGRHPSDPAAYVRQAIRTEPDPAKRFLPIY